MVASPVVTTVADPLLAQEPRPGWEAAPYAGFLAFDEGFRVADVFGFRGLKDSPVYGGRLGYTLGRRVGVEGSLAYSGHTLEPSALVGSSELDVSFLAFAADALLYLASGSVLPFVSAGVGSLTFEVDGESGAEESSSGAIASLGGGLKLPLTPAFVLRVDARDLLVRREARSLGSLFGGDGTLRHNIAVSAGVSLRFGGPGDADGDRVYDDRDACPGSPRGATVDERGCVPGGPGATPPVKTDEDGDGVSDALDRCPGTRRGAVVDLDGCVLDEGTPAGPDR